MLDALLKASKAVAVGVQASLAEQYPELARELDLPQRQRFLELAARGFDTFAFGVVRATRGPGAGPAATGAGGISLGPAAPPDAEAAARQEADDEAFAVKFARMFLDMGGIFPKLAQVLSLRPDLIKNERVLRRLRSVQEECHSQPFDKALALVLRESAPFRDGDLELRDWPRFVHAGSIAQVAPFVRSRVEPGGDETAEHTPDGVVKLTFAEAREQMQVDFRLLRFQLKIMERSGQWARGMQGVRGLSPEHLRLVQEVWSVMVGMEGEILQEFDLRHEASCQQRGSVVIEGLLGPSGSGEDCPWLEEWRDQAVHSVLRPAGDRVAEQARQSWRGAGSPGHRPGGGWFRRMARWAVGGRALAAGVAEGEEHMIRLRSALKGLRVCVPGVLAEASGPHVLAMELAAGHSLKEVLDVAMEGAAGPGPPGEAAKKAAAWFATLLVLVIVPLWGKMLLEVGCCHADPHPGNFKVGGIPGLDDNDPDEEVQPATSRGVSCGLFRTRRRSSSANDEGATAPQQGLTFAVLDWGSCVELGEDMRRTICQLIIGLSDLRQAQQVLEDQASNTDAAAREAESIRKVAASVRTLGVQVGEGHENRDAFQAALGMALFDPAVASRHPLLRGGQAQEELGRSVNMESAVGKVLRVVAILVGMCRELEKRLNAEVAERLPGKGDQPFVDLFLVELWRPFAEEGLRTT